MLEGKSAQLDGEHVERLVSLRPELSAYLGEAHRPGLPDPTPAGRAAVLELLTAWRDARDRLPPDEIGDPLYFGIDQRVFSASLELLRFSEQEIAMHRRDPDVLRDPLQLLVSDRSAPGLPAEERFSLLAARLVALPGYLRAARAVVTAPDRRLAEEARATIDAARALLRAVVRDAKRAVAAAALPPALAEDTERAAGEAEDGVAEHAAWLAGLEVHDEGWRVGAEHLDQLLLLRGLDISSMEMADLSRSMVEEMRIEQQRVLKRFFRKASRDEAIALARSQRPLSSDELSAWTRELVEQARSFVVGSELFPIAPEEQLTVDTVPAGLGALPHGALLLAPRRRGWPATGRLLLPRTDSEDDLASYSVADLENLVAFHAYPGAHFFRVWADRSTTIARAGAPAGFVAGVAGTWGLDAVLGWANHVEELMRELAFRDSPAARLLAVRHALYRAVLAYVDVALATGALDPERARELLVEDGGASPRTAAADVRACTRRPTENLSPLLGKMRLMQLRREAKALWRDRYSERRFHEFVLFAGEMPLAYHFELLDAPPPYTSDEGTAEYNLGEAPDDPRKPLVGAAAAPLEATDDGQPREGASSEEGSG